VPLKIALEQYRGNGFPGSKPSSLHYFGWVPELTNKSICHSVFISKVPSVYGNHKWPVLDSQAPISSLRGDGVAKQGCTWNCYRRSIHGFDQLDLAFHMKEYQSILLGADDDVKLSIVKHNDGDICVRNKQGDYRTIVTTMMNYRMIFVHSWVILNYERNFLNSCPTKVYS